VGGDGPTRRRATGRGAARHGLVPQMIELISGFLENDIAYVISDGVYLDVSRVPTTDSWPASHSTAFAPVTASKPSAKSVATRFRAVEERNRGAELARALRRRRPGWHTECVVMSSDSWATTSISTAAAWT